MRGHRSLETLCTVCQTMVGVKVHYRRQLPDSARVARHRVPGSERVQVNGQKTRLPICTGGGIEVPETAVIPVEVSA